MAQQGPAVPSAVLAPLAQPDSASALPPGPCRQHENAPEPFLHKAEQILLQLPPLIHQMPDEVALAGPVVVLENPVLWRFPAMRRKNNAVMWFFI